MGEGEQGSSEADGEGGDVMAEVEKERGEQGSKVKQREMGVMAEDEEEKAEAGEVEKERFKCSDCENDYAFLHKLLHHKTWNCKKKEEVENIKMDVARRPLSSNVFSLEIEEGEKEERGKGEEEERGKEEEEPSEVLEKSTVSIKYMSL